MVSNQNLPHSHIANYIDDQFSGLAIRYPSMRKKFGKQSHIIGNRAKDCKVKLPSGDIKRLFEVLRDRKFVLINTASNDQIYTYLKIKWNKKINYVTLNDETKLYFNRVCLINTDGFIAWATNKIDIHDFDCAIRNILYL